MRKYFRPVRIDSLKRINNLIIGIVFFTPLLYKIYLVEQELNYYTAVRGFGGLQVFAHDSILYLAFILILYASSLKVINRTIRRIFRIAVIAFFGIYVADIVILSNFSTHLIPTDVAKYIGYTAKYIMRSYGFSMLLFGCFSIAILLTILLLFILDESVIAPKSHHYFPLLAIAIVLGVSYLMRDKSRYIHTWMYQNVIEYNVMISGQSANYSAKFRDNLLAAKIDSAMNCENKRINKTNIVLVIMESLSAYQSKFFSNIDNLTPNLDEIAGNNISFLNFYANGYNTEDCLISILTGLPPISAPAHFSVGGSISFRGFYSSERSLPNILKAKGYMTEFLSNEDLAFSNLRQWIKSIGFDYIEGQDHSFYRNFKNWKDYNLRGPPDHALYLRAIDRIFKVTRTQPFMMVISTLSTHHPFLNPETGHYSQAEVFRYADRQLGEFYKKLKKNGFFDCGILIITGDHHAMVPLKEEEIGKYGDIRAPARIPLVISFGDQVQRIENKPFQQMDLYNSLVNYVSSEKCTSRWYGDFLSLPTKPADFIIHKRGDNRDMVSVFYKDNNIQIRLNGDKTKIVNSPTLDRNISELLINKINFERINRQDNERMEKGLFF